MAQYPNVNIIEKQSHSFESNNDFITIYAGAFTLDSALISTLPKNTPIFIDQSSELYLKGTSPDALVVQQYLNNSDTAALKISIASSSSVSDLEQAYSAFNNDPDFFDICICNEAEPKAAIQTVNKKCLFYVGIPAMVSVTALNIQNEIQTFIESLSIPSSKAADVVIFGNRIKTESNSQNIAASMAGLKESLAMVNGRQTPAAGIQNGSIGAQVIYNFGDNINEQIFQSYNVNMFKNFRSGPVCWGNATQEKTGPFTSLTVRNVFNYCEFNIRELCYFFVLQPNTFQTRSQLKYQIQQFLQNLVISGSIQAFDVICDNSNNTQNDFAEGILNVNVQITPVNSVQIINLVFSINENQVNSSSS